MTALALAGRLVTTAGILDEGVLEVRPDGTIGYVGPASGWSGPAPEPVDTVAPGYVDIHCHGGGGHTVTSPDPAEVAAVAAHHLSRGTTTMLASLVSASTPEPRRRDRGDRLGRSGRGHRSSAATSRGPSWTRRTEAHTTPPSCACPGPTSSPPGWRPGSTTPVAPRSGW